MSVSRTGRASNRGTGTPIRQLASHARLLRDLSHTPVPPTRPRRGGPDAIIVPSTRPASAVTGVIDLAARLGTEIVILSSRQSNPDRVADRISARGARGLAISFDGYEPPLPGFETSSRSLTAPSGGRSSDLSTKRNVGLLLARLQGWRKIIFVDDDITLSLPDATRLADQLDNHRIAGMICRQYPDNSVVCHARRLAKLPQDVFVTGAVLGVNCCDLPLPFFPDIYNEDWFFFGEAAAHRELAKVGEARQAEYNPFAEPARAVHEEFGDVVAEGLYSLLENQFHSGMTRRPRDFFSQITKLATEKYWSSFIDVRRQQLADTRSRLAGFTRQGNCSDDVHDAIKSLEAADNRYDDRDDSAISASRCMEFVDAWRRDVETWNTMYLYTHSVGTNEDAIDRLGITTWQAVGYESTLRSRAASATPCADVLA